jgi:pimeloyl-ACP methyl ester carboxylesterase
MKNVNRTFIGKAITSLLSLKLLLLSAAFGQIPGPIKNIVLVHGAFVDGSGWKPVYDILVKRGYHVFVVQQPLTSFQNDLAAVQRVLDMQTGSCILVGHSYGGGLITEAGNNPHVVGLVYIAAHAPDKGESEADNGKRFPPVYNSLEKPADG